MEKELLEKFKKYMDMYGKNYIPDAFKYINENFDRFLGADIIPDVLRQIYTALGIIKENDFYLEHVKNLNSIYGLNSNIIEVGCGFYPAIAEYIDNAQRLLDKGTITAYDPLLVVDNLGKINLYKSEFTENTAVDNCDLIAGIMPCEATETIINKANENNKNFYLALCGCVHIENDYGYYHYSLQNWYDYVYSLAEKTLPYGKILEIKHLDECFCCEYPIILSRDKK